MLLALGVFGIIGIILALGGIVHGMATRPGNRGYESDPTYSFTRLGNNRGEGGPPPVILGKKNRITPQLVSTTLGTTKGVQAFRGLYLLGRGEIASMESDWRDRLRVNGQSVKSLAGVTATFRYGTATQTAIPGSEQVGTAYDVGNATLRLGTAAKEYEIRSTAAETFQLSFVAGGGIFKQDRKGRQLDSAAGIEVEYYDSQERKWHPPFIIDPQTSEANQKKYKSGYFVWCDIKNENTEWTRTEESGKGGPIAGRLFAINNTRSAVNLQLNLHFPDPALIAPGRHTKIRVRGVVANEADDVRETTWHTVIEVRPHSNTYAGYALMYLEGIASEEVQGGVPDVELDCTGLLVTDPRTGVTAQSENPGVLIREVLSNTAWGMGLDLPAGILDDGSGSTFRSFMDFCDAQVTPSKSNGLTAAEAAFRLNYVLGTRSSSDEHLGAMLATCRATLYEVQGKIRIAWDAAGASTRDFDARLSTSGRRNVLLGADDRTSIIERQVPESERYNRVRILYVDSEDGYQKRTVDLPASASVGVTVSERVLDLQLFGIAYRSQATREARYRLNEALHSTLLIDLQGAFGDADLVPEDKFTVYDDYRYPSGKVWRLMGTGWGVDGVTSIRGREYEAAVYSDNTDTVTVSQGSSSAGKAGGKSSSSAPPPASGSSAPTSTAGAVKSAVGTLLGSFTSK